jgi:restriction endonuclease S subunit
LGRFFRNANPHPPISTQRALVAEYNVVQNRINLNDQLIQILEQTAQAIYKKFFVEEVDESWEKGTLQDLILFKMENQNQVKVEFILFMGEMELLNL